MKKDKTTADTYYDLFGVDAKATSEEIKTAYRNKLKEWHPDLNPGRAKEAEEMTKILNQAYGILSHPALRKSYDKMLKFTKGKSFERVNDENFWSKFGKVSPSFKKTVDHIRDLYSLFRDSVTGNYKLHPLTFGAIGGGLLYFLMPFDFIPDLIPLLGFVDDMAILTTIINSLEGELQAYRRWKQEKSAK